MWHQFFLSFPAAISGFVPSLLPRNIRVDDGSIQQMRKSELAARRFRVVQLSFSPSLREKSGVHSTLRGLSGTIENMNDLHLNPNRLESTYLTEI
jgi:hypothetical protein